MPHSVNPIPEINHGQNLQTCLFKNVFAFIVFVASGFSAMCINFSDPGGCISIFVVLLLIFGEKLVK